MSESINRRSFLGVSAASLGYFMTADAVSAVRAADKPSETLRIAGIGVGGKGSSDISQAGKIGKVVAICDIDENHLNAKAKEFADAKKFFDFRKLYDEMEKEIDAVVVSTPDHTHALASVMGLIRKKHVYCQKPLTHSVFEARVMRELAKKYGVCTQMGNQGTAEDGLRKAVEFVQAGGIGDVTQVHVWTNRPVWPQAEITKRPPEKPVPPHVHWDEFIGPAPFRPYAEYEGGNRRGAYHPFNWRGYWDFGTGALGDMACHTANMAFMALKLKYPKTAAAESAPLNPETYPAWAHVTLEFPEREKMVPVTWHWYEGKKDGKFVLPDPMLVKGAGKRDDGPSVYFEDGKWFFRQEPKGNASHVSSGSFLVGTKGVLFSPNDYGAVVYIVTPDGVKRLTGKPEKLASNGRGDQGMKDEWAAAIKAGKPEVAYSNFDYAGILTEAILLGNVAIRAGKKLEWDGEKLLVTNEKSANDFVKRTYRKGWDFVKELS